VGYAADRMLPLRSARWLLVVALLAGGAACSDAGADDGDAGAPDQATGDHDQATDARADAGGRDQAVTDAADEPEPDAADDVAPDDAGDDTPPEAPPEAPPPDAMAAYMGPKFVDVTAASGLDYLHESENDCSFELCTPADKMAGGAAPGDFDGDGLVDLVVTRLLAPPILFHNDGDGTFSDVTAGSGLEVAATNTTGVAWADVDNDGDLDLGVTSTNATPRHYLFINDGHGVFTEEAVERGFALETGLPHFGTTIGFGDYDRDGYLDAFIGEWRRIGIDVSGSIEGSNARLLHNLGEAAPGHFEDVTEAAGITVPAGGDDVQVYSPLWADLDDDGWLDLALGADHHTTQLYWNNHDGTFANGTAAAGVALGQTDMGASIADYDGDGRLDWLLADIGPPRKGARGNMLHRNLGGRTFKNVSVAAGVWAGGWGWSIGFFDYDNDRDLDVVSTNGYYDGGYKDDLLPLWRQNPDHTFTELAAEAGIDDEREGRALVIWDYDRDGDLDFFVANNNGHPRLWRNDGGNDQDWLRVEVRQSLSNRQALGARITLRETPAAPAQMREMGTTTCYLGHSERIAHFGLGPRSDEPVAEVRVRWPRTGKETVWKDVPRRTTLVALAPADAE